MRSLVALIATLLVASACATSAEAPGAKLAGATPQNFVRADEPDNRWVCEMVRPVGSMIPEQQCREVRLRKLERQIAQDYMYKGGRMPGKPTN